MVTARLSEGVLSMTTSFPAVRLTSIAQAGRCGADTSAALRQCREDIQLKPLRKGNLPPQQ